MLGVLKFNQIGRRWLVAGRPLRVVQQVRRSRAALSGSPIDPLRCRYARVVGNEISHPGENGIGLTGSTLWVDGRSGNQPRHNLIANNLIHHVGLYTKQSCGIFLALSCHNEIVSNVLWAGPRALINMNDGFGGNTTIRRNLLFTAVQDSGDHG